MPVLLDVQSPYLRTVLTAAAYASARSEIQTSILVQPTFAVLLEIRNNGRIFRLNEPLYLSRYAENGYIYLESKLLSTIGYGQSLASAAEDFQEEFAVLWDAVAQCEDELLTREAQIVKRNLLKAVNAVVPE
jgi:hypothetical protein